MSIVANMGKLTKVITLILISILAINLAKAFGYFRKDDAFDLFGMHSFGLFMGLGLFALIVVALLFVFWLWMLIDCLKRDFKKDVEKIVWVLVIIFLQLLGAMIYYFVVKISEKNKASVKKK